MGSTLLLVDVLGAAQVLLVGSLDVLVLVLHIVGLQVTVSSHFSLRFACLIQELVLGNHVLALYVSIPSV